VTKHDAKLLAHYRCEARRQLWRDGSAAEYLLDTAGPTGGQQAWLRGLDALPPLFWAAWKIGRQRGKTFSWLTWNIQKHGVELQKGGRPTYSAYVAQTGGNATGIVAAYMKAVVDDLPPEWGVAFVDDEVRFANGAVMSVYGTDNKQYRRHRGNAVKRVGLDESAFYESLLEVEQVFVPQLQTTRGNGVYFSSPPLSPAHHFNARCRAAQAVGRYVWDNYKSNPRVDEEQLVRSEMDRTGLTREELLASSDFRREYGAEDVTDENRAAVKTWNADAQAALVAEWETPQHFDGYEAHDAGVTGDPHASLFAVFDPVSNTLLVVDELEKRSATTTVKQWVTEVQEKESTLWGTNSWAGTLLGLSEWKQRVDELPEFLRGSVEKSAPRQPYLRVGDEAQGICRDMSVDYGLAVVPTSKHNKAMVADLVAQLVADRRLRIHSRCKRLVMQLNTTLWDVQRRRWERTETDHGDLVDCLLYIVRNVRWTRDCRPPVKSPEIFSVPKWAQPKPTTRNLDALKGLMR